MKYIIGTLLFGLTIFVIVNLPFALADIYIPNWVNCIWAFLSLIFGYFLTRWVYAY